MLSQSMALLVCPPVLHSGLTRRLMLLSSRLGRAADISEHLEFLRMTSDSRCFRAQPQPQQWPLQLRCCNPQRASSQHNPYDVEQGLRTLGPASACDAVDGDK